MYYYQKSALNFNTATYLKSYKYFDVGFPGGNKRLFVVKIISGVYTDVIVTRVEDKNKHRWNFTSRSSRCLVSCGRFEEVTLQKGRCWETFFFVLFLTFCEIKDIPFSRSVWRCWWLDGSFCWVLALVGVGRFRSDSLSSDGGWGEEGRGESIKQVYFRPLFSRKEEKR